MRVIVIPEDKQIAVDGEFRVVEMDYDATIHAIQWYDTFGDIEYKIGSAEYFTDASIIQPYIEAWEALTPEI